MTGSSMNPARTLGPALIMNNTGKIFISLLLYYSCNPRNTYCHENLFLDFTPFYKKVAS
jgi:hypothetical protein